MSHKPSDIINEGVAEEHVKASKPVTVAPPTSPPVYRGDFESRGEHKDIIPRTFWVGIWDTAFFTLAGIASVVLTVLILLNTVGHSWWGIPIALSFWAVTAYLTLPRFHAIMTRIYVPDYFIGRTRTPDGLLGDPVNIGIIGSEEQIHQVMQDAGWTRADEVTLVSSWKIIVSTITRKSYSEAPVSPLKIFGRVQSFAYQQEVDGNPKKRHHVRFWRTPDGWLLPGGHRVDWLAAGTYDSGVGFSFFTLQVTHRIDADTDFERDYIVESIQYAHPSTRVDIIEDFSTGYHSRNGGGDTIRTDGALPIITLSNEGVKDPRQVKDLNLASAHDLAYEMPAGLLIASVMMIISTLLELANAVLTVVNHQELRSTVLRSDASEEITALLAGEQGQTFLTVLSGVLLAVTLVFSLVHLFLLWSTLRGSSKARRLVLLLLAVSFTVTAGGIIWGHQHMPLSALFFQLGVSVFAMLGFTSDAAVSYTAARTFHMRDIRLRHRGSRRKQTSS